MAANKRDILISILGDSSNYAKASKKAADSTDSLAGSVQQLGRTIINTYAAKQLVGWGVQAAKAAGNVGEAINKANVIFGRSAEEIVDWSKTTADSIGQSQQSALDAASTFAVFGKSAGLAGDDLVGFSKDFTVLASDLASFHNSSPEEAIQAIGAALRGESEPIRRFGVMLDDATLKARAMKLGIYEGTGALTQQQKVLAAQAEILAQTTDAQGDFTRTADSAANQARTLEAQYANMQATIGQALLPVMSKLVSIVSEVFGWFNSLDPATQRVIVTIGLVAGAAYVGVSAFQAMSIAVKALGVSVGTAMKTLGALGALITAATVVYSVYNQRKEEAAARTRDLRDALLGEADAQNDALLALAENDEEVRRFLDTTRRLGMSVDDVAEYVRTGSGAMADLADRIDDANDASKGIYPNLYNIAKAAGADDVLKGATNWEDWYQSADRATQEAASDIRDWSDELGRLRDAQIRTVETQELVNAVVDEGGNQVAELGDKADTAASNFDDLKASYEGLMGILDTNDAYRNAEDALDDLEEAATAAWVANTTGAEDAAKKNRAYQQALDDAKRKLVDYATKVGNLPEERVTEILADIDNMSLDEVRWTLAELEKARKITFVVDVKDGKTVLKGSNGQQIGFAWTADGGYFNQPEVRGVGEAGPEAVLPLSRPGRLAELLADPRIGGPVAAALPMVQASGGRGAGMVVHEEIHVHVAGSVIAERDLRASVEAGVRDANRRQGRDTLRGSRVPV